MNALIDQWGARNVGFILMGLAGLCAIAAAMVGWEAFQRGMGILALDRAQTAALTDDRRATIAHGREAAAWMPREAAAGLMAVDLSDPKAGAELTRLDQRVPMKDRQRIAAILALHQLHHGGTPGQASLAAGDQALVTHLIKLAKGDAPSALTFPDSDPPQAPLLAYAAQRRFRAAWALGDREFIRVTAGELRLLMPHHPDIRGVDVVLSALTTAVTDDAVRSLASMMAKGDKRDLVLLKLMVIAPTRAAVIKTLLPTTAGSTP